MVISPHRVINKHNLPVISDISDGVMLLVNKPLEWTSFDVVNKIRASIKHGLNLKKIKVGHAGTLDPMATGLLLVCVGKYTKAIDSIIGHNKSYVASIKFGATTASYDSEAVEENIKILPPDLTEDMIREVVYSFLGPQLQKPPIFSAIKINGQTAHKLARRGKEVELEARPIIIHHIDNIQISLPYATVEISCSKGTYIRSLAHDIGQKLDVGSYLSALQRTKIEDYNVSDGLTVEEVVNWVNTLPRGI